MINFNDHINLIHLTLNHYFNMSKPNPDYDDYFQIGAIGLIKAINSFDESKALQFSTFAIACINNEVLSYIRKNNRKCAKPTIPDVSFESSDFSPEYYLPSQDDTIEEYSKKEIIDKFNSLSFPNKDLYVDWLNGMTNKQLSIKYKKSITSINNNIKKITNYLRRTIL